MQVWGNEGECQKKKYDKKGAASQRNFLEKQGQRELRIYFHEECGFWHLTHWTAYFRGASGGDFKFQNRMRKRLDMRHRRRGITDEEDEGII